MADYEGNPNETFLRANESRLIQLAEGAEELTTETAVGVVIDGRTDQLLALKNGWNYEYLGQRSPTATDEQLLQEVMRRNLKTENDARVRARGLQIDASVQEALDRGESDSNAIQLLRYGTFVESLATLPYANGVVNIIVSKLSDVETIDSAKAIEIVEDDDLIRSTMKMIFVGDRLTDVSAHDNASRDNLILGCTRLLLPSDTKKVIDMLTSREPLDEEELRRTIEGIGAGYQGRADFEGINWLMQMVRERVIAARSSMEMFLEHSMRTPSMEKLEHFEGLVKVLLDT